MVNTLGTTKTIGIIDALINIMPIGIINGEQLFSIMNVRSITPLVLSGLLIMIILLPSCSPDLTGEVVLDTESLDTQSTQEDVELYLQVPLEDTEDQRNELRNEIESMDLNASRRQIYEPYIDKIGANGIIKVLHKINPTCHGEAHDLGKIVFARIGSIGPALKTCDNACYSACMHGVMMEAFSTTVPEHDHAPDTNESHDHHIEVSDIAPLLTDFCFEDIDYKAGDCAHGIGHALMAVSEYDIKKAVESCDSFERQSMAYYCSTGSYMEFMNVLEEQTYNESLFYPCDKSLFPAACFRYKMPHVLRRLTKNMTPSQSLSDLVKECSKLEEFQRLGCFHGIGNAHMPHISINPDLLRVVCKYGTLEDQKVCVDGAIERLSRYHPESAKKACSLITGDHKQWCLDAMERKLYDLDKSFDLFFE